MDSTSTNSSAPGVLFMPHANLQYSQLSPERRAWVIEQSYQRLFERIDQGPYKIAFEASGETIALIARHAPDTLDLMVRLMGEGKIEGVASPHTHIMLANIDPRIGRESLIHGRDTWEAHTGFRPTVGWNPECSWNSHLLDMFREAGFESLVMDADSFFLSFPEIRKATGLAFDVSGHSNKNHLFRIEDYIQDKPEFLRFLTNPGRAANGMKLIFRSDMMANLMLWYLMGATEGVREAPVDGAEIRGMLNRWKGRIAATGRFIMPYAEDAEYIGTSAYFYVKQFSQDRFFEPEPESVDRFQTLMDTALESGYEMRLPSELLADVEAILEIPEIANVENGVAWHGGTAKAWLNTPQARILDPVCREIFDGLLAVADHLGHDLSELPPSLRNALRLLTSAYVSDARWPPAPTSPGRFNVREAVNDLYAANEALAEAMESAGIAEQRSFYSPPLMHTRIAAVESELMAMRSSRRKEENIRKSLQMQYARIVARRSLRTRRCRRPPAWARRRGRGAPDEAADWPRRPRGW